MKFKIEFFFQYVSDCFGDVPINVTVGLLIVFCVGSIILLASFGLKKGSKWIAGLFLLEYLLLIVCMTLLIRPDYGIRMYKITPFWSYRVTGDVLIQGIANIAAFFPLGLLLGYVFNNIEWWGLALIGGCLSFLIEILQFSFRRGVAELDDIFHNVLGCMIGYGVYIAITHIVKSLLKSRPSSPIN